ncbi:MAG: ribonuclease III domain-containing protein [Eubacteriales bacterium]|nr:ribonuclease III domain-containing protein [Eubacteriales bacterium]
MVTEQIDTAHEAFAVRDTRELNPLQMAYLGDTLHDLYVRSLLVGRGMTVGAMHKQAVRMVSAFAQARMMEAIEPELTQAEADVARRGRNSQAKHAAPKHADPADYAHATGLESLWGYLYLSGQTQRLDALIRLALERTEDIWQKRTSR